MKFLSLIFISALIVPLSIKAENNVLPQNAELQWLVCDKNLELLVERLQLSVKKVKHRQVKLWDTLDGDLIQNNWTVRVRENHKQLSFSAKKNFYRPLYRAPKGSQCELDMKVTGEKVGCSIKVKSQTLNLPDEIKHALKQDERVVEYLDRAKFWGSAQSTNIEFKDNVELELLTFRRFHRIEFSVRVPVSLRFIAWTEWDQLLRQRGIKLCPSNSEIGSLDLLREFTESL